MGFRDFFRINVGPFSVVLVIKIVKDHAIWHFVSYQGHTAVWPLVNLFLINNYGPLTEPKISIVNFGRTAIPTLNGRISETKRDFLDPLVPKFSYDRGLSPTLS